MSIYFTGSNIKADIEADVTFEDGSFISCNPGVDFCSARLFRCRQLNYPFIAGSPFSGSFETAESPDFGENKYALKFVAGYNYYIEDVTEFSLNQEYIIDHGADPDRKRFFEAWITYYPTSPYSLTVQSIGSNALQRLDTGDLEIKPYLEAILEQTIPVNGTGYLGGGYTSWPGIRISVPGTDQMLVCIYGGNGGYLLEWNGTSFDVVWSHTTSRVYGFASASYLDEDTQSIAALVYEDGGSQRLKEIQKDVGGTENWLQTNDRAWGGGARDVGLAASITYRYLLVGGNTADGMTYDLDDLSIIYQGGSNEDYAKFVPTHYQFYTKASNYIYGYYNGYNTFLVTREVVIQTSYRSTSSSAGTEGPSDDHIYRFYMQNPVGPMYKIYAGQNYHINATGVNFPTGSEAYYCNDFAVNFDSNRIIWAPGYGKSHDIYAYNFSVHKKYTGYFYPIMDNYYLCAGGTTDVKVIRIDQKGHTNFSPADVTTGCTTPSPISNITDFECPDVAAGTSTKFLFSYDNATYYKWSGSAWVVEADLANGNTKAEFTAGCQAGFTFPADVFTIHVKIRLETTDDEITPQIALSGLKIHVTIISVVNNAYMSDDSKLKVEYISDTQTKITSLMEPNVIVSYQLGLVAPPYNVDYEN